MRRRLIPMFLCAAAVLATGVAPVGAQASAGSDPAHQVPSRGGVRRAPTGAGPLVGRVIVVDPGHNGRYVAAVNTRLVPAGNGQRKACNTSGTSTRAGLSEHAHNYDVARRLVAMLRAAGATVVITRPDDAGVGPCVNERAAIGNRAGADLVVSIHADGNTATGARGFHVIVSTSMTGGAGVQAASRRLAVVVRGQFLSTGMPISNYAGSHGISLRRDIAGLNLSDVPAVMIEVGNMRHRADASLLASPAFRQREARALAAAVVQALP